MHAQRHVATALAFLLAGCVGTGKVTDPAPSEAEVEEAPTSIVTRTHDSKLPEVSPLRIPNTHVTKNFNISFSHADPAAAATAAKAALVEAGAEVTNFSASGDYGNINVRAKDGRCEGMVPALRELGFAVVSESVSENDLRAAIRQNQSRLRDLALADREITKWMRGVADTEAMDGLLILLELSRNDRTNQESQLANYAAQAEHCQLYVNFQKTQ